MSTSKEPKSVEPPKAANDGVATELTEEAIQNLAGYFDVLIQMDLTQKQSNEYRSKHEDFI